MTKIEKIKQQQDNDKHIPNYKDRINALKILKEAILKYETDVLKAFVKDLNKSPKETYLCEISEAISEIENQIRHLKQWMKPKKVKSSYQVFGTKSKLIAKPKGKVLIIVPFNYPFNLCFIPLAGALAAGNKVLIKYSNQTPNINKAMDKIIDFAFQSKYVSTIEDKDLNNYDDIYKYEPNMIFFTGSTKVGKIIEAECVKRNIDYVTELGGQCPLVIDEVINKSIYDRIVWSKFLNGGQTCVGINYIIYNEAIDNFATNLSLSTYKQYPDVIKNQNMVKIINEQTFDRLVKIIKQHSTQIIYGGNYNKKTLMIEPTIIELPITELGNYGELFGPILFIAKTNKTIEQIVEIINGIDNSPLAAYIYSKDKNKIDYFLNHINAGGYCVNDSVIHLTNSNLPFGGVYTSGTGVYHGEYSFKSFSFIKPVIYNNSRYNIPIKFINNDIDYNKTKRLINFVKKFKK